MDNGTNLPEELILEILLRLPVKSLVRFKCVSESWLSLISDPHFAKSHFDLAAASTRRFICLRSSRFEVRSLDLDASLHNDAATVKPHFPIPKSAPRNIFGSCRGFILVDNHPDLIIWNPSTGFHKILSYPIVASRFHTIKYYKFLYGFGYDASTDDYLVIIVWYNGTPADSVSHSEFFSLRSNSWKEMEGTHFPRIKGIDYRTGAGLLCNGALHWFSFEGNASNIIAFDLIERSLSEIPIPDDFRGGKSCYFRVMGGCLSLIVFHNIIEIWVMKEYKVKSSWAKSIFVSPEIYPPALSPICFTKGGELVAKNGYVRLAKFNDKGELLERCDYGSGPEWITTMYTESLLPLPSDSKEAENDSQEAEKMINDKRTRRIMATKYVENVLNRCLYVLPLLGMTMLLVLAVWNKISSLI